jgi:hypothetical protein
VTCECGDLVKSGFCDLQDANGLVLEGGYYLYSLLTGRKEVFSGLKLVIAVNGEEYASEVRCSTHIPYEDLLEAVSVLLERDGLFLVREGLVSEFSSGGQV